MGYSEVLKGRLFMGSKPPLDEALPFDTVVFCAVEYQPEARHFLPARAFYAPMNDDGSSMTNAERRIAILTGRMVSGRIRDRKRALVTCALGLNRSGLVCALALTDLGFSSDQAIALVRRARGTFALRNRDFVALLHSRPYGARVLERVE